MRINDKRKTQLISAFSVRLSNNCASKVGGFGDYSIDYLLNSKEDVKSKGVE